MNTKVAFFIPSLRGGGAERVMISLANEFAELGAEVDLVVVNAEGPYRSEVSNKVRIINLKSHRVILSLRACIKYMTSNKPDSIISTMSHLNAVVIIAKKLSRVDSKIYVREANTITMDIGGGNSFKNKIITPLLRFLYPYTDGIVAPSFGVYDDMLASINIDKSKVSVIYNPVDVDDINARAILEQTYSWFTQIDGAVILAVGRLSKQKNFSYLINAFLLVKEKYDKPVSLVILGEGEDRAKLQNQIEKMNLVNDVFMPGFVDNPFWFMKRADVFVLSSLWEGLPNVLLQALALNMSVVSTDCPSGPKEILEEGKRGSLVPVNNTENMALAIISSLTNKNKSQDLMAREYIEDKFSAKNIALKYYQLMLS